MDCYVECQPGIACRHLQRLWHFIVILNVLNVETNKSEVVSLIRFMINTGVLFIINITLIDFVSFQKNHFPYPCLIIKMQNLRLS